MKIRVSFKDPDTLDDSIKRAVDDSMKEIIGMPADEFEAIRETRLEREKERCAKWFKWGEYLTVDVDTEAGTCTVVAS